jgi:hypothetical protein
MARLEDYLPKTDELEDEITQAVVNTTERKEEAKTTIPQRFEGKSTEEVAQSYTELEKLNSRQAQDLGDMRKQVDSLVRESLEAKTAAKAQEEEYTPVSVDDLYDDPESAIEKVIERKLRPQLEATQQELQGRRADEQLDKMDAEFEGWREQAETEEFHNWVEASPYRQRMAGAVREAGDLDAANDLMAQYYELQGKQASNAREDKAKKVGDATLTSGGASYSEPTETMSRKELMNVRIRARQGDRKADAWLKENQTSIQLAYSEGRIVD